MDLFSKSIVLIALIVTSMANGQKLEKGDEAPAFAALTIEGKSLDLDNLKKDGKTVFISFLRYAGCPVCNLRVHELSEQYEGLKAQNIQLIVVFESSEETLMEYTKDANLPFPIIADEDNVFYDSFGVKKSFGKVLKTAFNKDAKSKMKQGKELYGDKKYKRDGALTRIPADFVINPQGIIETAHYGTYIGDHLDLDSLKN